MKPTGSITFLVSSTPTVDNLLKQIPAFEKQTGIKVNVANIDYDSMTTKETLDLRSKTGQYDVFWVEGTFLGRYVGQLHGLEPLDTYAASQGVDLGLSDFPTQLKQNFSMDGHLYAMPFEATLMMQAYRTDLYQKAGMQPATALPAYLSNVAKLNNPPKVYGTEVMGQRGEPIFYEWVNWLWGEGVSFDSSGQPTIDSPQAIKALEDVITLAKSAPAGTVNYGWDQATTAFGQGNVTTAVLFSDQTPGLLDPTASKVTGKWAYSPFRARGSHRLRRLLMGHERLLEQQAGGPRLHPVGYHDGVAAADVLDHFRMRLHPLLLRPQDQEVHDDEDQDEGEQLHQHAAVAAAAEQTTDRPLRICGRNEHESFP